MGWRPCAMRPVARPGCRINSFAREVRRATVHVKFGELYRSPRNCVQSAMRQCVRWLDLLAFRRSLLYIPPGWWAQHARSRDHMRSPHIFQACRAGAAWHSDACAQVMKNERACCASAFLARAYFFIIGNTALLLPACKLGTLL